LVTIDTVFFSELTELIMPAAALYHTTFFALSSGSHLGQRQVRKVGELTMLHGRTWRYWAIRLAGGAKGLAVWRGVGELCFAFNFQIPL